MKELVSSASQPSKDGSQPTKVDINALYFEAVSGEMKRRVYGLGSQASSLYSVSFHNRRTSDSSQTTARVREIVQQELADKQADLDRKNVELTT